MAALLLCAAALLVTSVPASAHAEYSHDDQKLTSPPSSYNPQQQLAVIPLPGLNECLGTFPKVRFCATDVWNTITRKQPRLGKTCCKVFGELQDECIYKLVQALDIAVFGLGVWIRFLRSGCTEVGW
ncbi:hypothetical protein ACLOJK_016509 [Asimina triloba]